MAPRANFECRPCEKTIPDLPAESTRCPLCGKKRGFRRLYDAIQVNVRRPRPARILEGKRDAAKYIDEQMGPAVDRHTSRKDSAKRFETALKDVEDRIHEQATPEQRQMIEQHQGPNGMRRINVPAAAALGAIDPLARYDSANYTYPQIKRTVQPLWNK